ncbi:MAG: cupin domain-containing protein [Oxalicibacterium faecigallinarum]|uniref:XRE family transcriptional regulator n=1 Tax=Oxalicibacterium faecigallinarum TaxID=573741 RepID=A0A8J3AS08_9BURK|nr:cupin domain-containing protein [Oxalicibacterium faecigallinarum]MDQ7969759.1 cupin domain-containing protein [Oxalicibacterium faecigallinarum]GGI20548.1 XRE family transcriptional regulator [Oxalicibacterium faecigallinarum]
MKKKSEVVAETEASEKKGGPGGLAVRLRYARLIAGLTLMQVAQKAECSESLISKIERGSATPSLAMLHRLANALDTNISTLMSDEAPPAGPVLRQGERPIIRTGDIALERLVLPTRGGLLQANIHIVAPGGASDGQIEHVGEEVGYVLEGELELRLGKESYVVGPGDTFSFQSNTPHGYRNVGEVEAKVLWVNSPATF